MRQWNGTRHAPPPPLPNPFPYVSYPGSPIRSLCTENTQNWHWNKRNLQRKCCPVFSFFKQTQHSCGFELSRNLALLPNKWLHFSWTKNLNWRLACWSHNSTFGKENGMCNIFPSNGIKKKKKEKKKHLCGSCGSNSLSRGLKVKLKCRWCHLHKFVESLSYCLGTVWKAYLFLKYKRGYRESLIRTSRGHA